MAKHKHAQLIHKWADGAEIQYWNEFSNKWMDTPEPVWDTFSYYRLKADAWKDDIVQAILQGKTIERIVQVGIWEKADVLHRLVRLDEVEHYDWGKEQDYRIKQDPVFAYAYSHPNVNEWYIASRLMTEGEAEETFKTRNLEYRKLNVI